MSVTYSILFAYRNRDAKRVRWSLLSLKKQSNKNFEVLFIDYGSTDRYSKSVERAVDQFSFASYHYIAHPGLLWNKSKALNYGIINAKSNQIIIADIDVMFAPNFIQVCNDYVSHDSFTLFRIGYLSKRTNLKITENTQFKALKPTHVGDTFGIGRFPKVFLEKVMGLDTFFHFYGSEDADLNSRLETAGCQKNRVDEVIMLHQWHPRYTKYRDSELTILPRLYNVQRINQQHYLWQKQIGTSIPLLSKNWSVVYNRDNEAVLKNPDVYLKRYNIKAHVIHFLRHELRKYEDKVVAVTFKEAPFYGTLKYKLKQVFGKINQPYISMKQVNDLILNEIIFNFKDHNYAYSISEDKKSIDFILDLKNFNPNNGKN